MLKRRRGIRVFTQINRETTPATSHEGEVCGEVSNERISTLSVSKYTNPLTAITFRSAQGLGYVVLGYHDLGNWDEKLAEENDNLSLYVFLRTYHGVRQYCYEVCKYSY